MGKHFWINGSVAVMALFFIYQVNGQHAYSLKKDWAVGFNAGASFLTGTNESVTAPDFSGDDRNVGACYSLSVYKRLGQVVSFRGQFGTGAVAGTDRPQIRRIETEYLHGLFLAQINLSTLVVRYNSENRRGSLNLLAGAGYTGWKNSYSHLYTDESKQSPERKETEAAVFPAGLKVNYKISHKWEISLESVMHFVNSDRFDGMENAKNDSYNHTSIGITYNFIRGKQKAGMKVVAAEKQYDHEINNPKNVEIVTLEDKQDQTNLSHYTVLEKNLIEYEAVTGDANPWDDVIFRVQVFASRTRQNTDKFARRHEITSRIDENRVGDWFKYTIGEFNKYSKAKDYRNLLVSRNKVLDAFVVAYVKDSQVPLSQLMAGKRGTAGREPIPMGVSGAGVTFSVQVLAAKDLKMSVEDFKKEYNIREETRIQKYDDLYQLVSGNFTEYKDAKEYRRRLIEKGLADAFIVAYQNGNRISIDDAFESKKIMHR
ncbi:MAG: SPOR domain-containing protein [Bacteroidales bacterium]|nr:SPOR domain-containing protein [Bacteroidales bacterium]